MTKILLTGFSPFADRNVNASWIAASLLQRHINLLGVLAVEIPVVWGEPEKVLEKLLDEHNPEIVISMGEGKTGCIQLETLALNQRAQKKDNNDSFPSASEILAGGPAKVISSAPLVEIRNALIDKGIPVLLSSNAGGFLCEELLYVLEHSCLQHPGVKLAMFVHLPPYGTSLKFKQQERICDDELLLDFSSELIDIVT